MNSLKLIGKAVVKLGKGLLAVYLVLFATTLIVQSCSKSEVVRKDPAAERLLAAVKKQGEALRAIQARPASSFMRSVAYNGSTSVENQFEQIVHISFEDMPTNPSYTYDINGMANLITNYNGVLTYEPIENSYTFLVPLEEVSNTLNPLVTEARAYLNAKGLTDPEIDQMIQEEAAQEVDLVPFATALAEYESSGSGAIGMNYTNIVANAAYAGGGVLHCAAVALGVDALWALGGSNAATWSKSAMKTAFKAVAKRALGPIGVAIAVVSFGLCMGDWLP